MERRTQRTNGVIVYVGAHNKDAGGQTPFEISSRGVREILVRLAAYEDTGLTPAEIRSMRMDMAIIRTLFRDAEVERLKELASADREGNVVVLPCGVGHWLYVPDFEAHTVANIRVQGISITPAGRVVLRFGGYPVDSAWGDRCGIDWFFTYESAEAALRRYENA